MSEAPYVYERREKKDGAPEKAPGVHLWSVWLLVGCWLAVSLTKTLSREIWDLNDRSTEAAHSRSKRFVIMTSERRLALPPKSTMSMESTLSLPGFNPLPLGFLSETAISIPFDIKFDDLGLTSEENTFGNLTIVNRLSNWVSPMLESTRSWFGQFSDLFATAKVEMRKSGGGGERSLMYQVVEDALSNLGINGKSCLLRAICEVHAHSLFGHGMVGEILELFLSVSSSTSYLHLLEDYLAAETVGKTTFQCSKYHDECPLSLFGSLSEKEHHTEQEIRQKFIEDESLYSDHFHYEDGSDENSIRMTRESVDYFRKNHTARSGLSRQKRFIFFGPTGRLRLPLATIYVIKPQIRLPWMTNLPKGYGSSLSIGVPLRVIFDDLGLTSLLNPFGQVPFFRKKRDTWTPLPGVNYEGGDREYLYAYLEEMLNNWGIRGSDCIKRAICEINQTPLKNYGFFGEVLHLFLRPSRSPHHGIRLGDYVEAERLGEKSKYCAPYETLCPHSIFRTLEQRQN